MDHSQAGDVENFWAVVEKKLLLAGMTKAQFAERLGISPQGLSSWKQRNQFRRACLSTAAELLGWPELDETSAVRDYGVTIMGGRVQQANKGEKDEFLQALRSVNKSYRKNIIYFNRYSEKTFPVLDSLQEGGFFAFSACTSSPYEFEKSEEGRKLARSIAKALVRGVLCLYIRPTAKGVSYYTKRWGYGRVVEHDEAVKEIENFRGQVKNDMTRGLCGEEILPEDAERLVYERMDQCYVNRSPMWLPGVGLSMFGRLRSHELTARIGISMPGSKFGGVLIYPQYYAIEFRFGRFLRKVVLDACREIKSPKNDATDGRVQLIIPESRKKELERFYERYSQLLRSVSSIDPPDSALS